MDVFSRAAASAMACGRLAQARVDGLHASVGQRAADDLGADVVAVEPGLGDQDADGRLRVAAHRVNPLAMFTLRISDVPPPMSVNRTSRR